MNARDYFAVLRENKLIIALCLVIGLGLGWGATQIMPKTYQSSVTFIVQAGSTSVGQQNPNADLYSGMQLAKDRVKSYTELITGARVAQDAANRLGGSGITAGEIQSRVTVTATADTVLLTLTASGQTADDAVTLIKAVGAAFQAVVEQVETQKTNGVAETTTTNGVTQNIPPIATVQQLDAPVAPSDPVTPKLSLNVGIGALLGLVVGFGIAIGRRSLDTSVRTPEELERVTEAAVLGVVPEDRAKGASAIPGGSGAGATAEAYRRIRTNLEFSNVDGNRRVLVITSALPEEGKTTTACNLAMTLAAIGARVLLVDGDLRRPAAAAMLGLEGSVGITTVLTGKVELRRAIQSGNIGGIDVLASGRTPPRPNELLASRRAAAMINELRGMYDFVLIDAPPILPVADAMNLGTHADGAIVVCQWGKTSRQSVAAAAAALRGVSVPVIGAVLTRVSPKAKSPVTYHGTYGSGPADPDLMLDVPGDYRRVESRAAEPKPVLRPIIERPKEQPRPAESRPVEQHQPAAPRRVEPRPPERPGGFRMDTPKKPAAEEFNHVDYAERTTLLEAEATSLLPKKAAADDPGAATSLMPQVSKAATDKNGSKPAAPAPPAPAKAAPAAPAPAPSPGPSPHPRTAPQAPPPPPPPPARPGSTES